MNDLANLYKRQDEYELAVPLYVECLAARKRVLGDDHPDTLSSIDTLRLFNEEKNVRDQA
jgi:hypothetical protein